MKNIFSILLIALVLFSCNKKEKEVPKQKIEPIVKDFGFVLNSFDVVRDTIKNGDTFGSILEKQNLGINKPFEVIEKVKDSFDLKMIKKGNSFVLLRSKDSQKKLQIFVYQIDRASYYVVDLRNSISVTKKIRPITYRERTIAGALNGSLYESLNKEGANDVLAGKLTKIYAWSIDFFKLQKGDKFGVTFTERFIDDTINDGVDSLKAAFFEYRGKKIYAFPFAQNPNSKNLDYFDEEGKALKSFFLKAPLKFANITSHYSQNRFHPVQMIWKAHKGTDYAAPTGTPIMTTATGIVEQAGFTAGNGNFVKVKHDRTYSTQYLHMSKILVKRGQHVTQGEVIGKVGSTGLATGPHVCYRFWKNGEQVDALKLQLPHSETMDKKNLSRFLAQSKLLKQNLDNIAASKLKNNSN